MLFLPFLFDCALFLPFSLPPSPVPCLPSSFLLSSPLLPPPLLLASLPHSLTQSTSSSHSIRPEHLSPPPREPTISVESCSLPPTLTFTSMGYVLKTLCGREVCCVGYPISTLCIQYTLFCYVVDHIAQSAVLLKGGACTRFVNVPDIHALKKHMIPALNGSY